MMRVMSSVGKPTDVSTITMVTNPACGIPAAPMLAAVAVMLVKAGEIANCGNKVAAKSSWKSDT